MHKASMWLFSMSNRAPLPWQVQTLAILPPADWPGPAHARATLNPHWSADGDKNSNSAEAECVCSRPHHLADTLWELTLWELWDDSLPWLQHPLSANWYPCLC